MMEQRGGELGSASLLRHGIKYTGQWKNSLRDGHGLQDKMFVKAEVGQEWPDGAKFEGVSGVYGFQFA